MKNIRILMTILALLPSLLCMGKKGESPDTISARRAFMEMPVGSLDMLSKNARFDMLAYFDNDSIYGATNNLKGKAYLQKVTDSFLQVKLTEVSTLQLKILKNKDGNDIIMTIYTVGRDGETLDSEIRFYDPRLAELPTEKYFPTPKLSDFFDTKGYKTSMKDIESILPFYAIELKANPDNSNLTGRITIGDILTTEDMKLVEMFIRPGVTYVWNGKSYSIKK